MNLGNLIKHYVKRSESRKINPKEITVNEEVRERCGGCSLHSKCKKTQKTTEQTTKNIYNHKKGYLIRFSGVKDLNKINKQTIRMQEILRENYGLETFAYGAGKSELPSMVGCGIDVLKTADKANLPIKKQPKEQQKKFDGFSLLLVKNDINFSKM